MATNDIGRVTPIWRGIYSDAASYELNDIVLDAGGSVWWHVSAEITTGTAPGSGETWAPVIDMRIFAEDIRTAIEEAQAAVQEAEEARSGVTADADRAETAAENAEIYARNASESAADVGAYAQAAEAAKTAAQTAKAGAEAAQTAAETAKSGAETAKTGAETAKTGAEAAQTAAETAQTGAEAARTGAEQAAASVSAATALITQTAQTADLLTGAVLEDANNGLMWSQGAIASATGNLPSTSSPSATRICTREPLPDSVLRIEPEDGMQYGVFCYDSPTETTGHYLGAWNGSEFSVSAGTGLWQTGVIDLPTLAAAAEDQDGLSEHWFRLTLAYVQPNTAITPENGILLNLEASRIAEIEGRLDDPLKVIAGIPTLALEGDVSGMDQDNAKTLTYTLFGDDSNLKRTGTCTVKWQGSSSLRYPKHNYTIKFDNALDAWRLWQGYLYDYYNSPSTGTGDNRERDTLAQNWTKPVVIPDSVPEGWGEQKKYCFKANWIDASHLRNIIGARLWGEMCASRGTRTHTAAITDKRTEAPNWGAIDGFPTIITINGEFAGLYTFNIPKDGWTFAMGEGASEYVVCGEGNTNRMTQWRPASASSAVALDGNDYSLEYPDKTPETISAAAASLTAAIQSVRGCVPGTEDWKAAVSPYLDVDSVFDYFIHALCVYNNDGFARNILYGTYDGEKWFMSAYDMDSTFGFDPYGSRVFHVVPQEFNPTAMTGERASLANASTMNGLANLAIHDPTFKDRYRELRNGILSDAHVLEVMNGLGVFIPDPVYRSDRKRWPSMPASESHNIAQFMNFYREHCAFLDREAGIAEEVAAPVIGTASGFPLIPGDATEGRRFRSVRIPFGPVQAGSGDPSPSNIRKLTPRTPAFYRCGPNLYSGEGDTPNTAYDSEGVIGPSSAGAKLTGHIPVSGESGVVLLVWCGTSGAKQSQVRVGAYDADGTMLNGGALIYKTGVSTGFLLVPSLTLPEGTATIRVSLYGAWGLGIFGASAAESLTLTLPDGSVGGGVWDPVTGTLTVDRLYKSLDGTEEWVIPPGGVAGTDKAYFYLVIGARGSVVNDSGICSHFMPVNITSGNTDVGQKIVNSSANPPSARLLIRPEDAANATVDTFKAWLAAQASAGTPVQVCWRLAEPVVYTVDAVDVTVLNGVNTLFSNAWEYGADYGITAEYIQDTGAAIEEANASTRAMIAEAQTVTASRSLAVGEYVTVGAKLYRVTAAVGQGETLVPGGNVTETTVGEELTGAARELTAHETDAGEELRILAEIADRTYAGRDLTAVFASEIAQSGGDPWAWIKGRITAGNYNGIHVGDWIPYTDTSAAPKTRNARIMGIDTYRQYGDTAVGHHIDFWGGLWNTKKPINKANYNNGTSESEFPWLASDGYLYANSLAGKVPSAATANPTLVDVDYTADGIWYYLPDTLKAQIKAKRFYLEKRYTAGELLTESNAVGWADLGKIWFPTEYEVYGAPVWGGDRYAGIGSAVQYPFFMNNMNRLAFGRTNWWFLTPRSGNSTTWCYVSSSGFAYSSYASSANFAAPICFRIA